MLLYELSHQCLHRQILSMRSFSLYSKHLECVVEKIRALDFTKETNTFVILHKVKDGNVIT
jgi:hypothetical protein